MTRYEPRIIGFAIANCKVCHGTGRIGYLGTVENGVVQPCHCVTYFESSRLKEEFEKIHGKQEQPGVRGTVGAQ